MIQNNLDGREETAMLGAKRGAQSPTADTTHTKGSSQPSFRPPPTNSSKTHKIFEMARGCDEDI